MSPSVEDKGVVVAAPERERKPADGGEKEKLEAADKGEAKRERGEPVDVPAVGALRAGLVCGVCWVACLEREDAGECPWLAMSVDLAGSMYRVCIEAGFEIS